MNRYRELYDRQFAITVNYWRWRRWNRIKNQIHGATGPMAIVMSIMAIVIALTK